MLIKEITKSPGPKRYADKSKFIVWPWVTVMTRGVDDADGEALREVDKAAALLLILEADERMAADDAAAAALEEEAGAVETIT